MPPPFATSAPPSSTFVGTGKAVSWTWAEAQGEIAAGTEAGELVVAAEETLSPFIAVAPEVLLPALLAAALLPSIARQFQTPPTLPPMSFPFTGGQSAGVRYVVTWRRKVSGNPVDTESFTLNGPVLGIFASGSPAGFSQCYALVAQGGAQEISAGCLPGGASWDEIPHIISAVREDGQPDTGGDPLPRFSPPATYPNQSRPTTITLPGGITLPITPTLVPYNVPSRVNPGDPTSPPDPHTEYPAPIQVRIPEIPININFSPSGVELVPEFEPQTSSRQSSPVTTTAPPLLPSKSPTDECKCEPETNDIDAQLKAIKDELDAIKKCACGPNTTIQTQTLGGGTGGSFGLPDMCLFVTVTLTTIPANAKSEYGGGGPDVYFAGWFSFGTPGFPAGDRIPISHQSSTFFPSTNASSCSFTVKEGYTASLTATFKMVQP